MAPPGESRRYDFPPLWAVPLLLILGIWVIVYLGFLYGLVWLVPGGVLIWWLQRKADAYVRERDRDS